MTRITVQETAENTKANCSKNFRRCRNDKMRASLSQLIRYLKNLKNVPEHKRWDLKTQLLNKIAEDGSLKHCQDFRKVSSGKQYEFLKKSKMNGDIGTKTSRPTLPGECRDEKVSSYRPFQFDCAGKYHLDDCLPQTSSHRSSNSDDSYNFNENSRWPEHCRYNHNCDYCRNQAAKSQCFVEEMQRYLQERRKSFSYNFTKNENQKERNMKFKRNKDVLNLRNGGVCPRRCYYCRQIIRENTQNKIQDLPPYKNIESGDFENESGDFKNRDKKSFGDCSSNGMNMCSGIRDKRYSPQYLRKYGEEKNYIKKCLYGRPDKFGRKYVKEHAIDNCVNFSRSFPYNSDEKRKIIDEYCLGRNFYDKFNTENKGSSRRSDNLSEDERSSGNTNYWRKNDPERFSNCDSFEKSNIESLRKPDVFYEQKERSADKTNRKRKTVAELPLDCEQREDSGVSSTAALRKEKIHFKQNEEILYENSGSFTKNKNNKTKINEEVVSDCHPSKESIQVEELFFRKRKMSLEQKEDRKRRRMIMQQLSLNSAASEVKHDNLNLSLTPSIPYQTREPVDLDSSKFNYSSFFEDDNSRNENYYKLMMMNMTLVNLTRERLDLSYFQCS